MIISVCMSSLYVVSTAVLVIMVQYCLGGLWHHTPLLWPKKLVLFATVENLQYFCGLLPALFLLAANASVTAAAAIPCLTSILQGTCMVKRASSSL